MLAEMGELKAAKAIFTEVSFHLPSHCLPCKVCVLATACGPCIDRGASLMGEAFASAGAGGSICRGRGQPTRCVGQCWRHSPGVTRRIRGGLAVGRRQSSFPWRPGSKAIAVAGPVTPPHPHPLCAHTHTLHHHKHISLPSGWLLRLSRMLSVIFAFSVPRRNFASQPSSTPLSCLPQICVWAEASLGVHFHMVCNAYQGHVLASYAYHIQSVFRG